MFIEDNCKKHQLQKLRMLARLGKIKMLFQEAQLSELTEEETIDLFRYEMPELSYIEALKLRYS